jgi:hypothetical protein
MRFRNDNKRQKDLPSRNINNIKGLDDDLKYKKSTNRTKIISFSPVPSVIEIGYLWTFNTPAPGTQVNNFILTTGPAESTLKWGDGNSVTISPNTSPSLNHTY